MSSYYVPYDRRALRPAFFRALPPHGCFRRPSPSSPQNFRNAPGNTSSAIRKSLRFWGIESAFRQVKGVTDVAVGYAGCTLPNPTYQDVCTDRTGHAEVVEVDYDPTQVSYEDLLRVFFEIHDPTQLNRQLAPITASNTVRSSSSTTPIEPAPQFYRGEEYHQRYFEKHNIAACRTH